MNFEAYTIDFPPVLLVERAEGRISTIPNPEYQLREAALLDRFRVDAMRELGLESHPKADEIWDFALIQGDYRARGLRWVYYFLESIAKFSSSAP